MAPRLMTTPDEARLRSLVEERAEVAGLSLSDDQSSRVAAYLAVLGLWNRRINLTAFDLFEPRAEAIDRLVIESFVAASLVRPDDKRGLDIGSGGGSPAVPLMIAVPGLVMVLVEARERKAAFLREALRTVGLVGSVEACRVQDLVGRGIARSLDLVSFRAVRADAGLWAAAESLLSGRGQVLWFGGIGQTTDSVELFELGRTPAAISLAFAPST